MHETVVSSANTYSDPEWADDGKSLVNTINSVGSNTDPWGMPVDTKSMSDLELQRLAGPPSGAPYSSWKRKRKPLSGFSHGYHGLWYCSWARTHDDDDDDDGGGDGVAQHGG